MVNVYEEWFKFPSNPYLTSGWSEEARTKPKSNDTGTGREVKIDNLTKIYVNGEGNAEKGCIIVAHDVYGW